MWMNAKKEDFFPGGYLQMVGRLVQGLSLFPNDTLHTSATRILPADKRFFRDIRGVKLYVTAANLNTGRLYVWGTDVDENASLVDAAPECRASLCISTDQNWQHPTGRWRCRHERPGGLGN